MTEDGKTTTYVYNGLNQLTKKTDSSGTTNYSYDLRGNQTEEKGPGLYRKYVYLVTGELAEVRNGAASMQENIYNHEGIRISREEDGDVRQYFHDRGSVAYTMENGSLSSSNIRNLDGSIISSARGSSSYLYTEDIQGSTGIILDSSFQSRNTYDYTDFGEVTVSGTSQIENEICYTGAVYDETTGLHYLNARYYDPENGRFISQDSYRGARDNPTQWHLYAYCANNPINYTDPSGHAAFWLNARYGACGAGHSAIILQVGKKWYYYSWGSKGYLSSSFQKKKNVAKDITGKRVKKSINTTVKRPEHKPYSTCIYLPGDFSKSENYINNSLALGNSFRNYSLTSTNCAWIAIHILRKSATDEKAKKLYNLQYKKKKIYQDGEWHTITKKRTIVPNEVVDDISRIYGQKIQSVS